MYRPSGKNFSLTKYTEAIDHIRLFLSSQDGSLENTHITFMGDFNFPKKIVEWKDSDLGLVADFTEGESIQKRAFDLLLSLTEDYQMEQLVSQPTRGKNVLDLVFSNQPFLFGNCRTTILKPQSDHKLINFDMVDPSTTPDSSSCHHPSSPHPQPEIATFTFGKADKEALEEALTGIRWRSKLRVTPTHKVSSLAGKFIDGLVEAATRAKVPKYSTREGRYVDPKHTRLVDARKRLQEKLDHPDCTKTDKQVLEERVVAANQRLQEWHEEERERLESKAVEKIKLDPKEFFKFANKTKKTKAKIGPLKSGTSFYSGPQKMAQILSDQYKSVFSRPRPEDKGFTFAKRSIRDLDDIHLTDDKLISEMQSIKMSSAPGPDGVPAFLYRTFAKQLAFPLRLLWQASLDSGKMPEGTLLAYITPILKTVDRSEPANYRPVALTNHMTKIFERVLRREITAHLEAEGLLNKTQHGFRNRHSTITQLLTYYDSILALMEGGDPVDAIYLDFAKAFDKVDHHILLKKVEGLGITGKLHSWIAEFLTNRQQQVRVDGHLSGKEWVMSGVPQGSVLGPLLFLIMLIDIDEEVKYSLLGSYADDTRLWRVIHNTDDQAMLQSDLQVLYDWAVRNNAAYNEKKFEQLTHGPESERRYTTPTGALITLKTSVRDLGVHFTGNGKFHEHINHIVKAATNVAAWVLRTFVTRNKWVMKVLLQSLVVPHLEYACPVWCPFDKAQIRMLENVQRRFTSRIAEYQSWDTGSPICTMNYWDRLADLRIYSLQRRRERFMILYAYRVVIGLISFPLIDAHAGRDGLVLEPRYNRRAPEQVRRSRHSSFFYKGPQLFNLLPPHLKVVELIENPGQEDMEKYKEKLDKFLEKIPDQPDADELTKMRAATTNSLICQIPLHRRNHPEDFEPPQDEEAENAA